jgi:hypothetical protein
MTDYTAADAALDQRLDDFYAWCADTDTDPADPDAWSAFDDDMCRAADPYAYHGVSRGDFG